MARAGGARASSLLLASACLVSGAGCSWLLGVSEDPLLDPSIAPPLAPDAAEASPDAGSDAEPVEAGAEDAAEEPIDPEDAGTDE